MKLGIFDSGLGGLLITKAVREHIPDIDIVYLGDTLHVPYGNRSDAAIYMYTQNAMQFLFDQGCNLIVNACNTSSAASLRKMQQEWLPKKHPGKNIIGVVVPTLEAALDGGHKKLGLIGTNYIIKSEVYPEELKKLDPVITIRQQATPLLVPLIENDGMQWTDDVLKHYLDPMLEEGIECLILGCTHYPFLKSHVKELIGNVALLSQDDVIPAKLASYLSRHPEYSGAMSKKSGMEFFVSDVTDNYRKAARTLYGQDIDIRKAELGV
jgi:glutamate racemase